PRIDSGGQHHGHYDHDDHNHGAVGGIGAAATRSGKPADAARPAVECGNRRAGADEPVYDAPRQPLETLRGLPAADSVPCLGGFYPRMRRWREAQRDAPRYVHHHRDGDVGLGVEGGHSHADCELRQLPRGGTATDQAATMNEPAAGIVDLCPLASSYCWGATRLRPGARIAPGSSHRSLANSAVAGSTAGRVWGTPERVSRGRPERAGQPVCWRAPETTGRG